MLFVFFFSFFSFHVFLLSLNLRLATSLQLQARNFPKRTHKKLSSTSKLTPIHLHFLLHNQNRLSQHQCGKSILCNAGFFHQKTQTHVNNALCPPTDTEDEPVSATISSQGPSSPSVGIVPPSTAVPVQSDSVYAVTFGLFPLPHEPLERPPWKLVKSLTLTQDLRGSRVSTLWTTPPAPAAWPQSGAVKLVM